MQRNWFHLGQMTLSSLWYDATEEGLLSEAGHLGLVLALVSSFSFPGTQFSPL